MNSRDTDTNDMDIPEELPYSEQSNSQISIPIEAPAEPAPVQIIAQKAVTDY